MAAITITSFHAKSTTCLPWPWFFLLFTSKAVQSQWKPRDAAVKFD